MRLTDFWQRMRTQFGSSYADSLARDHVLAQLGGHTVSEALEAGEPPQLVWRAVCEAFDVPARNR
jgi:hypothetical protein